MVGMLYALKVNTRGQYGKADWAVQDGYNHACKGKGLKHLLGTTQRVFSLFYIFETSIARNFHSIF